MFTKRTTLFFGDSYATVEMENNNGDYVLLTVSELEKDEEKSSADNEYLVPNKVTEICLDIDEVKEVIRSLQSLIPEEEIG